MSEVNQTLIKALSLMVKERVATDAMVTILIEKGIVSREEFNKAYEKAYEENARKYSAEALGMTEEEYTKIVNED